MFAIYVSSHHAKGDVYTHSRSAAIELNCYEKCEKISQPYLKKKLKDEKSGKDVGMNSS